MILIRILFLWVLLFFPSVQAKAASNEEEGKELYFSYGCAVCHGKDGDGNGISAQQSDPPPTNFHDVKKYRHGSDEGSIRYSLIRGIKEDNSVMPSFAHIPQEELNKIISDSKAENERQLKEIHQARNLIEANEILRAECKRLEGIIICNNGNG